MILLFQSKCEGIWSHVSICIYIFTGTEAMQLMKEGGKWELYIPSELAYGDRGAGGRIPGGSVLVFTLELLEVKGDYVQE